MKKNTRKTKKKEFQTVAGLLKNGQNKCPKSRNELLDEHHFLKKVSLLWHEGKFGMQKEKKGVTNIFSLAARPLDMAFM